MERLYRKPHPTFRDIFKSDLVVTALAINITVILALPAILIIFISLVMAWHVILGHVACGG